MSNDHKIVIHNLKNTFGELKRLLKKLISNKVGLYGELEILHLRNGEVIDRRFFPNVVTNDGLAEVAGLINGVTSGAFTYIAIGTGTTSETSSDTILETEITSGGGSRASATTSRVTTSQTNDTAQLQYTFSFTSSFAVTESGCFDASGPPPAGEMLCRKVFSAMNVANGDAIQITWKIQVQ